MAVASRDNGYWRAAVRPYGSAVLGGFHGVNWRTEQSVVAAMRVMSPVLQVS
jgi:hypothetical protein